MFKDVQKESSLLRILILLLILAVGIYIFNIIWQLLQSVGNIIIILLISWLLSFILEPIVALISRTSRIPKTISAVIVYLLLLIIIAAAVLLFIPTITAESKTLADFIPKYLNEAPKFVRRWADTMTSFLDNSISLIPSVAQFSFYVFIVFLFSFYFVVDKEKINRELLYIAPRKWHDKIKFTQAVIEQTFASFLRIQLIFAGLAGFSTWIIFRIFNIHSAASIAFLSGIFAFIPLIGPVLALIPPIFFTFPVNPTQSLVIFAILLVTQQIIFNIIGPKLFGKAFKLHPVIVLLSFLLGFQIAGGIGAIFAIPIIGILVITTRDLFHHLVEEIQ
ncbi:MAG: AI-2E family transporter [Patescibacteria group bacterium]|nr:AI-2E family transporter [Patescibacteria group bacterium]